MAGDPWGYELLFILGFLSDLASLVVVGDLLWLMVLFCSCCCLGHCASMRTYWEMEEGRKGVAGAGLVSVVAVTIDIVDALCLLLQSLLWWLLGARIISRSGKWTLGMLLGEFGCRKKNTDVPVHRHQN